jgi:hypothetical protein
MQLELRDTRRWKMRIELVNAIFECIEVFHNRRRRHSVSEADSIEFELSHINTQIGAA